MSKVQTTSNPLHITKGIKARLHKSKVHFVISTSHYAHLKSLSDLGFEVLTLQVHPRAIILEIKTTCSGFYTNRLHQILVPEQNNIQSRVSQLGLRASHES